jgi:hypothetical protein
MLGVHRCRNPQRVPPDALACLHAGGRAEAGGGRSKLWGAGRIPGDRGAAKRERGDRGRPRSRPPRANPRRANPKGASSGRRAKPTAGRQGLPGGQAQKPRPAGPASCFGGWFHLREETVGGCVRAETHGRLPGRRKLRRGNPRSAAGVKENRRGIEGRKPSRG